jgi:hypothetical protein
VSTYGTLLTTDDNLLAGVYPESPWQTRAVAHLERESAPRSAGPFGSRLIADQRAHADPRGLNDRPSAQKALYAKDVDGLSVA